VGVSVSDRGAGEQLGLGVGVDMNESLTGAVVGHDKAGLTMRRCAAETRQPPLEPVSPELLQAAVAAARQSTTTAVRKTRIPRIVARNGKGTPPPKARAD
jgi:hypothetical protein